MNSDKTCSCIKCIKNHYSLPFLIEEINKKYGFRLPNIKVGDYHISDPTQVICDESGKFIIGICDVFDDVESKPCLIKCRCCDFEINLKHLLKFDGTVRNLRHLDGAYRTEGQIELANTRKKEQGNEEIMFHGNPVLPGERANEFDIMNYHNCECMSGKHCHCILDYTPLKSFRFRLVSKKANGDFKEAIAMIHRFQHLTMFPVPIHMRPPFPPVKSSASQSASP
jgi:hypothetical protein